MSLNRLFLIGLICAFLAPNNVFAGDKKIYFSGSVGALFAQDSKLSSQDATLSAFATANDAKVDTDTGIALTAAVGMEFMPQVRGEVEYAYRTVSVNQVKSNVGNANLQGGVNINSLMFNAFYDLELKSSWTPYIGGGLGVAWTEADGFGGLGVTFQDQTVSDFAYQGMAGVAYKASDNLNLNVGYRYFGTSDADFTLLSASIDSHAVEFGLRYSF
jgi:opacity protein-like surface antigen